MSGAAVLIFTARGLPRILREGGTQAWALDPRRARRQQYAVLVQNRGFIERGDDWGETTEPHGMAFLVGRISDVVPTTDPDGDPTSRYLIRFNEYALIEKRNMWPGYRNPIYYTSLEDLGIDLRTLAFEPMPPPVETPEYPSPGIARRAGPSTSHRPLTIAEAKAGLAASLGVEIDAIEITIRG